MADSCSPSHDWFADLLTAGLCLGLIVSYLPQHLRIINKKSSEGFSPWFLLLGSTASASAALNLIALQWGVIRCCRVLSFGNCLEAVAGVLQVGLVWFLFTLILVLYMIYFPPHRKYLEIDIDGEDVVTPQHIKTPVKTDAWHLSIILSWVVFLHLIFETFVTFFLIATSPPGAQSEQIVAWATFLGVTAAALSALQYAPQLLHTYRAKLVGALSIPMMCIQSPGAVLMVLSIALRPGTNWTSWITYAVAGIMQAALLVMCVIWKFRQQRLGVDDFGHPLESDLSSSPAPVEDAVEAAVQSDVRANDGVPPSEDVLLESGDVGEETPLIRKDVVVEKRNWFERMTSTRR